MNSSTKDIWDIVEIVGTMISGILIPVAIFFVGNLYRKQKDKSDTLDRESERISQFIKHLTSENENERLLAIKISKYLNSNNQLPGELLSAMQLLSVTDEFSGSLATELLESQGQHAKEKPVIYKDILSRFIELLNESNNIFSNYFKGRNYLWVKKMAEVNYEARNLLLINTEIFPLHMRKSANAFIQHYNDWIKGYRNELSKWENDPTDEDKFNYIGAPRYMFPKDAEIYFRDEYSKIL